MRIIKQFILLLGLAAITAFAPDAAAKVYFDDGADLYSSSEEALLISDMEEASAYTGWNYGIVTMNNDYSSEVSAGKAAEKIYNTQFGEDSSGVLFLCDVGWRYVVVAGEAREYVVGSRFDNMIKEMKDYYFDYEDLSCAKAFIRRTTDYYGRGKGSFDLNPALFALAAAIGIAAGSGTVIGISHKYKRYEKPQTNNYLDVRSMNRYRENDIFERSFRTRVSNNTGGGGGGSSGGGGGFGGSHGGGGFGGHR